MTRDESFSHKMTANVTPVAQNHAPAARAVNGVNAQGHNGAATCGTKNSPSPTNEVSTASAMKVTRIHVGRSLRRARFVRGTRLWMRNTTISSGGTMTYTRTHTQAAIQVMNTGLLKWNLSMCKTVATSNSVVEVKAGGRLLRTFTQALSRRE